MSTNSVRAGALALACALGGCSASQIPIIGGFMPNPAVEDARNQQRDAMVQYTIRPGWKELVDGHRFKSALAYLESKRDQMSEATLKSLTDETQSENRMYLNNRMFRYRSQLSDLKSQKDLAAMKADDFSAAFQLPAPDELTSTSPAYDWARVQYGDLEDFRTRKPSGETMFKHVATAVALPADDDGERRWFDAMETLAFAAASDFVRAGAALAMESPKAEREEHLARATAVRNKWTLAVVQGIPADNPQRKRVEEHDLRLGALLETFPKDLPELDQIDISAAVAGDSPEASLRGLEKTLKGFESRNGLSKESRQRLYTMIVTVVSLRSFTQGKDEIDALGELKGYGAKLEKVGGPTDPKAFGARVQKVFDALR